jgi:hypothetical protein
MANKHECNENINYVVDEINEMDMNLDLDSFLTDFEQMEVNVQSQLDPSDEIRL